MKKILLLLLLVANTSFSKTCKIPVTQFDIKDGTTTYDHFKSHAIKYCKNGDQLHLNTIDYAESMGILSGIRGNWCNVKYPAYIEIDKEGNYSSVTCIYENH